MKHPFARQVIKQIKQANQSPPRGILGNGECTWGYIQRRRTWFSGPGLDIGNVETALETLTEACYYLAVERNRYRFSLKENLNKRFADRRATIQAKDVDEYV